MRRDIRMSSPLKATRSIAERPLTSNGIHVPNTVHSERHVVDMHYYKSLLRLQIKETSAELSQMTKEKEFYKHALGGYEKVRLDEVENQSRVAELKAELYDVSSALEILRQKQYDPGFGGLEALSRSREEIERNCLELVDARISLRDRVQERKSIVSEKSAQLESFISRLNANERAVVKQSRESNQQVRKDIYLMQKDLQEALKKENKLKTEVNGNAMVKLERDLKSTRARIHEAEKELVILEKPPLEQKESILQYVEEMNAKTLSIEHNVKQMLLQISSIQSGHAERRAARREESDRLQLIKAKGAEIDLLMRKLSDDRDMIESNISIVQSKIERIAEDKYIRKKVEADHNEQIFIETEVHASRHTATQLGLELQRRRAELSRLETAEATCVKEISDLRANAVKLEKHLADSLDVELLKKTKENELQELEERLMSTQTHENDLTAVLHDKNACLHAINMELSQNQFHQKLLSVDDKLKHVNEQIADLNQNMESILFTKEKAKLAQITRKINELLIFHQTQ